MSGIVSCLQYLILWNIIKLHIPAVFNLYKQYANLILIEC